MIRVALIDDHPLILKIVRQELSRELDMHIIWDVSNAAELIDHVNRDTPDVLVLDLGFSGQGFEPVSTVRDLRSLFPAMAVLILTAYDDPIWIEELIEAGAKGYVVKSDDFSLRLADGVRTVANGRTFLSPTAITALTQSQHQRTLTTRERTILRLAAEGHSNPQIASILGVANGTVRNHMSNIYAKLDVDNREAAVRKAQSLRELPRPGAHIRHELRTPLNTILGLTKLIQTQLEQNDMLTSDAHHEYLQQIIIEAERLNNLIENLGES